MRGAAERGFIGGCYGSIRGTDAEDRPAGLGARAGATSLHRTASRAGPRVPGLRGAGCGEIVARRFRLLVVMRGRSRAVGGQGRGEAGGERGTRHPTNGVALSTGVRGEREQRSGAGLCVCSGRRSKTSRGKPRGFFIFIFFIFIFYKNIFLIWKITEIYPGSRAAGAYPKKR